MALQPFPNCKHFTIPGGPTYSYVVHPARPRKPTFLLLHGFPSASYDWRNQIRDLSDAGYGVIAPDLLGYGNTDKPPGVEEYSVWRMAAHIAKLLEHEGISNVVAVGHDWGCGILGMLANRYPERLSALVFMAVPYTPPGTFDLDAFNSFTESLFGYPVFGYWQFFNESDAAELCDRHSESMTALSYPNNYEIWKTDLCPYGKARAWVTSDRKVGRPSWLSKPEVDTHNAILRNGGYVGPLNWYKASIRNIDVPNYSQIPPENLIISRPVLFLIADGDVVTRPELARQSAEQGRQEGYLPSVEVQELTGCGHWLQLEKPREVFNALDAFAKKVVR
ncbi:alpha/beta-hydrolase [Lindgomyces ingoldianus]|uniref:Alpha/beta-hydrolase n=1 Tax=Lindgomyces ingoldianus TaxID=673940 RepID=A0ACB6Q7I5_9PLEO|nr:alpha/beta-hydrolase [Lindgomyces ingoldianus]KAF2462797.1 alpha/beta-hydrolase [Lindgomyces ingoldianus]